MPRKTYRESMTDEAVQAMANSEKHSLAWFAERGDDNAKMYINFIGFATMACMLTVIIVGVIVIVKAIQGG